VDPRNHWRVRRLSTTKQADSCRAVLLVWGLLRSREPVPNVRHVWNAVRPRNTCHD
jgi:hypothetical protein